jgi:hypothetical protein
MKSFIICIPPAIIKVTTSRGMRKLGQVAQVRKMKIHMKLVGKPEEKQNLCMYYTGKMKCAHKPSMV